MSVDKTAELILAPNIRAITLAYDSTMTIPRFPPVADFQAMAKLWLIKDKILAFFKDLDDADKTESWAWHISEDLRKQIEALEDNDG